jgi:hypothetical protein
VINIKLIPDAKLSWRFWSTQATVLLGLVSSIQVELFPLLQPFFTPEQWRILLPVWTVIILVLRHIAQPALEPHRQQLDLDHAEATPPAALLADQLDDEAIEHMAAVLYEAGGLSKPWADVSAESKHRWRLVARAAVKRAPPADESTGGEHF